MSTMFWWHSGDNRSPYVTREFLERQRRLLLPAQYAREHQNQWVDAADSFVSVADVDAAMATGWGEQLAGDPAMPYVAGVDIGLVHDPTVIAVGHLDGGVVYLDRFLTFQGSREQPVRLADVEACL